MKKFFKKINSDCEAAEWLNERLLVPSNCYEITAVPDVDKVIISGDLISWEIFYQLQKAKPDLEPIMVGNYDVVDDKGDEVVLEGVPGGLYKIDYSRVLIICGKSFYKKAAAGLFYQGMKEAYFLIRKQFMENADGFCLYRKRENAVTLGKKLVNVDFLVVYDDDMISAAKASLMWYKLMDLFGEKGVNGKRRKIICLGGKGAMSKYLYRETEGELLKNTLIKLRIQSEDIVVLDGGSNTGENLRVLNQKINGQKAMIMVTQRLSAIFKYSQMQQFPEMDIVYCTIYQSLEDSCHLYNGMALYYRLPILHFWAHVVKRIKSYEGKFMAKVPGIDWRFEHMSARLQKRYVIKQPGHRLRTILQLLPILRDLRGKREMVRRDYENLIKKHQILLKKNFKPLLGL